MKSKIKIDLKYRDRQSGKTTKLIKKANKEKYPNDNVLFVITPNIARTVYGKTKSLVSILPSTKKELKKILKFKKPNKIFLDEFAFMNKKIFKYLIKYCIKNNINVLGYSSTKLIDKLKHKEYHA
jgi:thymidine kinase